MVSLSPDPLPLITPLPGTLLLLPSYFTDLKILDFETRDGLLFLLVTSKESPPVTAFHIVDMNVDDPGVVAEVIGQVATIKQGHGVAIEGRYAYILDNIMAPFYVGIVDISKPHDPAAQWLQLTGVNTKLVDQDIGTRWYILENASTLSGINSILLILSKETPPESLSHLRLGFVPREAFGGNSSGIIATRLFVDNDTLLFVGRTAEKLLSVEDTKWDTVLALFDASSAGAPEPVWTHTIEPGGRIIDAELCRDMLAVQNGSDSLLLLNVGEDDAVEQGRITRDQTLMDIAFGPGC